MRRYQSISPARSISSREVAPMPSHWKAPELLPFRLLFEALCLVATGSPSLDELWRLVHASRSEWKDYAQRCMTTYQNTNIVAALLLGATATLVTASSARPEIIDHTRSSTFICVLISFVLSLSSVCVASAVLFAMNGTEPKWLANELLKSNTRVWCDLYILAFPHGAVGVSVGVLAIGLITAATHSELRVVRIGCYFVALPAIMALFAFLHMVIDSRAIAGWIWNRIKRNKGPERVSEWKELESDSHRM
ncbi:hypothetical protein BDQ17DRAFT_1547445 [Cyathus striatus]|nr:hypothetical protein BDQ17DRAFT_1547445 [Cyathus striatus]